MFRFIIEILFVRPCVRASDATVPRFHSPAEPARTVGFRKRDSARTVGFRERDSENGETGFGPFRKRKNNGIQKNGKRDSERQTRQFHVLIRRQNWERDSEKRAAGQGRDRAGGRGAGRPDRAGQGGAGRPDRAGQGEGRGQIKLHSGRTSQARTGDFTVAFGHGHPLVVA